MSEDSANPRDVESVASDRLPGARAIGAEIGAPPHVVYRLFELGRLRGVYKDGNLLIGSKQVLRRNHYSRARSGK